MSAATDELRDLIGVLRKASPAGAARLGTLRKVAEILESETRALEERIANIEHLDRMRTAWPGGDGELRP
ncbi:MAG TPA: hypothetical protein VGM07_05145 [Stellaceae bacterium]|jgi:hypothetical protein